MSIIQHENYFYGFICVLENKYIYKIDISDSLVNQHSLKLDWRLKTILGSSLEAFLQSNYFCTPQEFHHKLTEFVTKEFELHKQSEARIENPLKIYSFFKKLKEEIKDVERFVKNIDFDEGLVKIEITDSQLRNHKATLRLNDCYLKKPLTIVNHDLPLQHIDLAHNSYDFDNIYSINEFCYKFEKLVQSFQEFWNIMSSLDSSCCVLDPVNPSNKDIMRRIKLTETLSVVLIFNPWFPKQRPIIKLLGCQSQVNHFREVLQQNLQDEIWDSEEDVLYNLSNVLKCAVPSKIYSEVKEVEIEKEEECAICFTWLLNNEIPNEMCEKSTCRSIYHSVCLFTYLSCVSKNRNYFGKIQGKCPNCDETISCSVPEFKK